MAKQVSKPIDDWVEIDDWQDLDTPQWQPTNQNEFNPELINKLPLVDRMQRAAMQPVQQFNQGANRAVSNNAGNVAAGATDIVGGMAGMMTLVPNLAGMAIKSAGVSDYVNPITAPIQATQGYMGAIESGVDKLLYSDKDRMQAITDEAIKARQDIQKNPFQSIMSANKRTVQSGVQNVMRNVAIAPMMEVGGQLPQAGLGGVRVAQGVAGNVASRVESMAQKPQFIAKKGIKQFDREISTTLRENIAPTRGGLEKVNTILSDLDNSSKSIRENATKGGAKIDFKEFNNYLEKSKAQYANDANATEKIAAVSDMQGRVSAMQAQYPNGQVPLDAAWRFKQTLQDMVGGKYDEVAGYAKEAAKDAAHGLLDDIIYKYPQLREIGLRQRDLIEAQGMIERRVAQQTTRNPLNFADARNLGRVAAGAAGGFVGGTTGALAGIGAELLVENPRIQHKTAVALDRLSNLGKEKVNPYAGYKPKPFVEPLNPITRKSRLLPQGAIEMPSGLQDRMRVTTNVVETPARKMLERGSTVLPYKGEDAINVVTGEYAKPQLRLPAYSESNVSRMIQNVTEQENKPIPQKNQPTGNPFFQMSNSGRNLPKRNYKGGKNKGKVVQLGKK